MFNYQRVLRFNDPPNVAAVEKQRPKHSTLVALPIRQLGVGHGVTTGGGGEGAQRLSGA